MKGGGLDSVVKLGFSFLVGSPSTYKVITNFLLKVRIRGEGRVGNRVGKLFLAFEWPLHCVLT